MREYGLSEGSQPAQISSTHQLSLASVLQPTMRHVVYRNIAMYRIVVNSETIERIVNRTDLSRGDIAQRLRRHDRTLPEQRLLPRH